MSIISIVYLPEGIVIAADSRLTGERKIKDDNGTDVLLRNFQYRITHKKSCY